MKKVYIAPSMGRVVMFQEEMICESIQFAGKGNRASSQYESLSKERENIDFSDEESIW